MDKKEIKILQLLLEKFLFENKGILNGMDTITDLEYQIDGGLK